MPKNIGRQTCPECGNNPVPHFLYWYFESSNVLLTPVRRWLLYNPVAKNLKKIAQRINFALKIVRLGKFLGILGFRDNKNLCRVERAKVLWDEAEKQGIKMQELLLFGKPFDCYVASKRSEDTRPTKPQTIIFSGLPRPSDYDDSTLDWLDDKIELKHKLTAVNLPVPKGGSCARLVEAVEIFNSLSHPVIVKPRLGSRGRHSTTFVSTVTELKMAFRVAKQLCFWVIVEEQLTGPVYRATLINYELCGVLRGDPPQVVGDGEHTIKELIEIKNSIPHPGVKDIIIDGLMEIFLLRQPPLRPPLVKGENEKGGIRLTDVPVPGQTINLSEKIGVNYGGSSAEELEICHEDNKKLFVKAAKTVSDPIIGFDFIIPDITKSWKTQRCGFIEANSLPFINLHHEPFLGRPKNIAEKVWQIAWK